MFSEMERLKRDLEERRPEQEIRIPNEPLLDIDAFLAEHTMPVYSELTRLPSVALRANLLYGFGTLTPNGGVEIGLNSRSTLLLTGSYNGWRKNDYKEDNKKLWHYLAGAEYRYWLCERFNGHFFGAHAFYGQYNIAGKKVPFVFEKGSENYRYQGYGAGAGLSYGYQYPFARHWSLEVNAGIGIGFLKYDKWECAHCGEKIEEDVSRTFVAPTKLGISLLYKF